MLIIHTRNSWIGCWFGSRRWRSCIKYEICIYIDVVRYLLGSALWEIDASAAFTCHAITSGCEMNGFEVKLDLTHQPYIHSHIHTHEHFLPLAPRPVDRLAATSRYAPTIANQPHYWRIMEEFEYTLENSQQFWDGTCAGCLLIEISTDNSGLS